MEIKPVQLGTAAKQANDTPEKMQKAAQEFEALMIGQMLKSVRESSGWGTQEQSGDVALEMAEQQMSKMLAANGGLGLAQLITKGLEQRLAASSNSAPPASKS